jgi:Xaa-Pro aminopeptidase
MPDLNNLESIKNIFKNQLFDAIIISAPINIKWASGFNGSNGWLFITSKEQSLMTDSRYETQANIQCPDWEIQIGERHGIKNILNKINRDSSKKIAILEDEFLLKDYFEIKENINNDKELIIISHQNNPITTLRMTKNSNEVQFIEQSAILASEVMNYGISNITEKITEKKLANLIEIYAKEQGADSMSFNTIVASGERSAMPHAIPSNQSILKNNITLIDLGVYLNEYASDITRTFWNGNKNKQYASYYNIVLLAQNIASERAEVGMNARDIHQIAETVFSEAGVSDLFIHGLGHGVGMEVHEKPYIDKNSEDKLCANAIITIEPGIYIRGWGGIRIEDMYQVTDTGLKQLTTANKHLI